jgi:site-specific recombinase XerD
MSSTTLGAAIGTASPLLSAWLGNEVPPTAELSHEAFQAIARCAQVICAWRAEETQWSTVRAIALDECTRLEAMSGAHSSSLAPQHANAMFGDFRNWPLYSSLVAGAANPTDSTWSFVASLVAWPSLGPNVAGMQVGKILQSHRLVLQTWLRESLRKPDLLATMRRILGDAASSPQHLQLQLANKSPKGHDGKLWAAVKAHANAYLRSYPETPLNPTPTSWEDANLQPLAGTIRKIIDHSVSSRPEHEGLAPDDVGATRYVSHDTREEDNSTDALARHGVRCLASKRELNHLPLHWTSLNFGERKILREALNIGMHTSSTREGTVAVALCALLALSPADVSALAIHTTLDGAIASMAKVSTTLVWVDNQLIALQGVPRPESAYRGKGGTFLLPHRAYKALGIPPQLSQAIDEAGGRTHDNLLRCFPTLVVQARKLAAEWRQATRARLHLGRIQRVIADCLMELTHDECIAALIVPGARIPTGAGSYYSAIPADRAFDLHRQAASEVLPWSPEDLPTTVAEHFRDCFIGSELLIPLDALGKALAALHDRARAASETGRRNLDVVAHAFNLQTMYLIALGALCTTHRPTHAPFPRPEDLQPALHRALIIDKRAHARSTQRVVPLPALLAAQVEAYRKSMLSVVLFLDDGHPGLAGALRSTLEEDAEQFPSAAALSLLTQVNGNWQLRPFAPEDWHALWPEWIWPLNGNRHVLMQWLQAQGIRRESLNYLFGHAEPGQTLFGRDCAVSIDEFCSEMAPMLERFGESLNIRQLKPIRTYGRVTIQAEPIRIAAPGFGDDARPQRRNTSLSGTDLETCRRILRDEAVAGAASTEERIRQLETLVAREFHRNASHRARVLALLKRWIRMHPTAKSLKEGKRIPFTVETTPVTRNELRDLVRGSQLQRALLRFSCEFVATEEAADKPDVVSWLALLSLSAIAFGGKHAPDTRRLWLDAVPGGTFHLDGSLWVEWTQAERLNRWCADPITGLLIARFLERVQTDAQRPADKDVRAAADRILAGLEPLLGISTAKRRLQAFGESVRALHRASIPGPLMAHMSGERQSAFVPRATLRRSTGVRLVTDPVMLEAMASKVGCAGPAAKHDADPAGSALKRLVSAIGKAQGSSQRGGSPSGKRGDRIQHLVDDLRQLESSTTGQHATLRIVCSRVKELATQGGRIKSILATSTIAAYMRPVIAFARTEVGGQFLSADPVAIEEVYRNLVMTGCTSKSYERLLSLQDFHEHAVLHYGAVPVDWHDIAADVPYAAKHVDANLVYQHEVDLASALIAAMTDLPAHVVLMARATMHLMHDLGLRFGEVFRLRAKDIFADNEYLYIRSTEHGEVKSFSGTRMVPLRDLLGAPGHEALSSLLARANALSNGDPLTPLFCDPNDPRALVLRSDIVRIVAHSLRVATGDITIRPHHLRHSAVTNSYGLLVVDDLSGAWARGAALRQVLVSEERVTRRATHAHSQLFGHGGPDTTALIYLHQQEFRVADWMGHLLLDMTSVEIASLAGWTDARVRKAWAAGRSTVDIMRTAVSALLENRRDLDAWRSIDITDALLPTTKGVAISRPTIELTTLREFLIHSVQTGLPPEALATLYGVPPVFAEALCRNTAVGVHHTAFALGFMSASAFQFWPGYAIRTTSAHQLPPHLRSLPSVKRMDEVSPSRQRTDTASTFVRTFDPDKNCWDVSTRTELDAVTHWMHLVGIQSRDVTFEIPCIEARVPDNLQLIAGPLRDANFVRVDPRQNRVRRGDRIRIRVRPDGSFAAATTLAQASFLWVVRSLASLEAN